MIRSDLFKIGICCTALVLSACQPDQVHQIPQNLATVDHCTLSRDSLFRFRSSFWLNLHNFLYKEARRSRGVDDDGPQARSIVMTSLDTGILTEEEADIWSDALDYYDEYVLRHGGRDSLVFRINYRLALVSEKSRLEGVNIDSNLKKILVTTAPMYRSRFWPQHDYQNRRWQKMLCGMLNEHETSLSTRIQSILDDTWDTATIPVDASVYASWFGAYTIMAPLHITISSTAIGNQGTLGLEILLHEAAHALTARVDSALAEAANDQQKDIPNQLGHHILFYTTGEIVRERFPEHTPYAERFGLWKRNGTAERTFRILQRKWQPFLDGERSFQAAVENVVSAF